MRISEVLARLTAKYGMGKLGTWELGGRKGITVGDPTKYFPHPTGPRYQIDTTDDENRELTPDEIAAIERRFGPIIT